MTLTRKDIEIMAPAGSRESLVAAADAGADSVYFGIGELNMRSRSSANFSAGDLADIVSFTRSRGVKSYLTLNTALYDGDMASMRETVDRAAAEGVDAVIVADQAAMLYARSRGLEVHASTQLNISNVEALRFYTQWVDVAVLARELDLGQIAAIHRAIEEQDICGPSGRRVKIEMFAHGALCMAVSGRCYLSLHESGCSANRGACRQICRRSYILTDSDTGEQIRTEGKYLLSPKDLCTVTFLDKFIAAGVRVLKIEGRARPAEYVRRVCESYGQAVDAIISGDYTPEMAAGLQGRLAEVFNRGFWEGYYAGKHTVELSKAYGSSATKRKEYVGKVTNFFHKISVAEITTEASVLCSDDEYVILGETTGAVEGTAVEIREELRRVAQSSKGVPCSIKTAVPVRRGDKLYKIVKC